MRVAPLPGTFMLFSIVGFFVSAFYVLNLSVAWGFAFCLVFGVMFIASIVSVFRADAETQLRMDEITFHKEVKEREVKSRSQVERMTKDEIKEYAAEFGIELSTNDLKDEMIDQFFEEVQ